MSRPAREPIDGNTPLPESVRSEVSRILGGPEAEIETSVARLQAEHPAHAAVIRQVVTERMATGTSDPAESHDEHLEIEQQVGPYRVLERLGKGGFGTVYVAEQTRPIERKVALKVLNPGMDSREFLARFEAERQALALMTHPNIARVLDAGATRWGRPYFVMEYVPGLPITGFCERSRLGLKARLELFIQVCEGVQHAHQKGIIHRDLSARNVLVTEIDGRPVPKIIDFGIAKSVGQKLTDITLHTNRFQVIGTPEYMSPEQAAGSADLDTRTDIYSLGVLLYELLTGSLPIPTEKLRELGSRQREDAIRSWEPERPSTRVMTRGTGQKSHLSGWAVDTLARKLKGDLDWITMKAMAKERDRRYGTALGLALEIRRHLNHEPVMAGPPTFGYRMGKLLRRYRGRVLAFAAVAIALVLGMVASFLSSRDEAARAQAAEQRALRAESELQRAQLLADVILLEELSESAATVTGSAADEWLQLGKALLDREPVVTRAVGELLRSGGGEQAWLLRTLQAHQQALEEFGRVQTGTLARVRRRIGR